MAVLGQLAEENDALAAHGVGDTRGRLFLQGVRGRVHTQAARETLRGRFHALRYTPGAAEQQTAEQQGSDPEPLERATSAADGRRGEDRRLTQAGGEL
jgi:hypothetical protein